MNKTLVIDDDNNLFNLLSEYLGAEGFECVHAPDADSGLERLTGGSWDVVILDVMLPGRNGFEMLRDMRERAGLRSLPVLMLTARGEESDKVTGLELGADDYLAKPFGPKELVARLRALLRRTAPAPAPELPADSFTLDDIRVNKTALCMEIGGVQIQISPSELRLMEVFADNPGSIIGRDTLSAKIFGRPPLAQERALDMLISRLRKKMGPRRDGGERIRAARGEGYIFLLPGQAR